MFFRKKKHRTADGILEESWRTSFRPFDKKRFETGSFDTYSAEIKKSALFLSIRKKNHFVWSSCGDEAYEDFCIDARLHFDSPGYSALGFLFRQVNDNNFYSFLYSKKGLFRFDTIMNGNPLFRFPWTKVIPDPELMPEDPDTVYIRIIARASFLSFYINNQWVGECDDTTFSRGQIAFAAQNYTENNSASLSLEEFSLESRPVQVETVYTRWQEVVPVNPDQRELLSQSLFNEGRFSLAVIQRKKIFQVRKPMLKDYLFLTECFINLRMYQEGLKSVEKALELAPENEEALLEKANLLYLANKTNALFAYGQELIERGISSDLLFSVLGNGCYSLGKWKQAADYYSRAIKINDSVPLYHINQAKCLQNSGDIPGCVASYGNAARLFYRDEEFSELEWILEQITRLDKDALEARILRGKMFFINLEFEEARQEFESLIRDDNCTDSTVWYLLGLIIARTVSPKESLPYLKKAHELEKEYPLFYFKWVEQKFLAGQKIGRDISTLKKKDGDNPWVHNLIGQYYLDAGSIDKAVDAFKSAVSFSDDITILINYSHALFLSGEREQAVEVLAGRESDPQAANQLGNIYLEMDEYDISQRYYERAYREEPDNRIYMENLAHCCLMTERYSRAEELLALIYDDNPSERCLEDLARIAWMKGQYLRAETIYAQGLQLYPESIHLKCAYAEYSLRRHKFTKAAELLEGVTDSNPRIQAIRVRIRTNTETRIECSECGREWWYPKKLEITRSFTLRGQPPDDSPAGECPKCGAIYCIECGKQHLVDGRFFCPECNVALTLKTEGLKYLVTKYCESL